MVHFAAQQLLVLVTQLLLLKTETAAPCLLLSYIILHISMNELISNDVAELERFLSCVGNFQNRRAPLKPTLKSSFLP